jgi:hypothetical protein
LKSKSLFEVSEDGTFTVGVIEPSIYTFVVTMLGAVHPSLEQLQSTLAGVIAIVLAVFPLFAPHDWNVVSTVKVSDTSEVK